tara:strand:- start:1126 stop:1548 length:423 start_codon:yes stop_codon:yes gene_type:complete
MKTDKLKALYLKYGLEKDDVFKHQHYIIITRSGIDKIQAQAAIHIEYDVINCDTNFCVVKARASHGYDGNKNIQTFGSALKGTSHKDGNCNTWYVMEMAEKRAMSRAVLKLTGFYELGVFGEDESEDFKKNKTNAPWKKR